VVILVLVQSSGHQVLVLEIVEVVRLKFISVSCVEVWNAWLFASTAPMRFHRYEAKFTLVTFKLT